MTTLSVTYAFVGEVRSTIDHSGCEMYYYHNYLHHPHVHHYRDRHRRRHRHLPTVIFKSPGLKIHGILNLSVPALPNGFVLSYEPMR